MYIKRNLEHTISSFINKPEIIAIVGPRQCGKTTLLKHIAAGLSGAVFLSFEDRKILDMFERQTDEFIKQYVRRCRYLFIDEFQYAKNGGKILKYIFDLHHVKIFISGSSAIDLTVKAVKFLVGRILVFTLHQFDFCEFLACHSPELAAYYKKYRWRFAASDYRPAEIPSGHSAELKKYYEEYALYGGYPRVVLSADIKEKREIIANIYNTYFLREVKDILGLIDDYKLLNLIKALAAQAGNLIDYQELSRLSEIAYPTLKKYLNFLGKTYICDLVRPFARNRRSEIVKNPKVYFFDNGLRHHALGDFRLLNDRPDKGAALENAVFGQLVKQPLAVKFWRDKQKHEVDFLLEGEEGRKMALEVKTTLRNEEFPARRIFERVYPEIKFLIAFLERADQSQQIKSAWPVYLL